MEYHLYQDPSAWGSLFESWAALLPESIFPLPFLHPSYQETWWQSLGGGEWSEQESKLAIITAHENGQLLGIAPLFISRKPGSETALHFIGAVEVSDYLDFVVRKPDLEAFLEGLLTFITSHPDLKNLALDLENLVDSSPSLTALENLAQVQGWSFSKEILQPSPYISLPADFETYLAGLDKKQRHEIRRKLRNAYTGHEARWYFVEDGKLLPAELQVFTEMMRNENDKDTFLKPEMERFIHAAAECLFDLGILRLAFLMIDDEKAAAFLSFTCCDRLLVYNSSRADKWMPLSPGWVLLARQIEWAISAGIKEVDMMRGDEGYKYKFGGVDRFVWRALLAPLP
ncbi:MAG TPA: GNAT family N-acetyltransferase [Anaerolineaceae bacterium]|nr:GNAT family N-acetyltransferase [Anaerolineaceae bacterium]